MLSKLLKLSCIYHEIPAICDSLLLENWGICYGDTGPIEMGAENYL